MTGINYPGRHQELAEGVQSLLSETNVFETFIGRNDAEVPEEVMEVVTVDNDDNGQRS